MANSFSPCEIESDGCRHHRTRRHTSLNVSRVDSRLRGNDDFCRSPRHPCDERAGHAASKAGTKVSTLHRKLVREAHCTELQRLWSIAPRTHPRHPREGGDPGGASVRGALSRSSSPRPSSSSRFSRVFCVRPSSSRKRVASMHSHLQVQSRLARDRSASRALSPIDRHRRPQDAVLVRGSATDDRCAVLHCVANDFGSNPRR